MDQVSYKLAITCTKISYLTLYLRIFPDRRFKNLVRIVLGLVASYGIASVVATCFQCRPFDKILDRTQAGRCFNIAAFWAANAFSNMVGNIVIIILPIPLISKLHIPWIKRGGLIFVFLLGSMLAKAFPYVSVPC